MKKQSKQNFSKILTQSFCAALEIENQWAISSQLKADHQLADS